MMTRSTGVLAACLATLLVGCSTPKTDPWQPDEYTVDPSRPRSLERGYLAVETPLQKVRAQERLIEIAERRYTDYRIFDATGRHVRDVEPYSDEFPHRIPLATGNYIVECKTGKKEWRRVQVRIARDQTTRVTLDDIAAGRLIREPD